MSSVQHLREFISQRLTAAAEEIFSEFEKTIVQYEEEMDRQRGLLEITWKPQINLHRIDLPGQNISKEEEDLADQTPPNQEKDSGLNQEVPELLQIKEEQEELSTSQEGEHLVLKQETDTFKWTLTCKENDVSEAEPATDQLFTQNSPLIERQNQEGNGNTDSESISDVEMQPKNRPHRNTSHSDQADSSLSNAKSGEKSGKCDVCGKVFRDKYVMKEHLKIHTGVKPYACETCGKCFTRKSNLLPHMRIHTGEKLFSCETCGRSFTQSSHLTAHRRTHTGEKSYFCQMCGKSFTQKNNLLAHTRTHTGEKPFTCRTCGKIFTYSSTLSVHMKIHTGERPYSCGTCGKKFKQSNNLKVHMRTHTGEKSYFCKICGKSFSQKNNLLAHMRTHTGEKPFTCRTCGKTFTHSSTLSMHKRIHTGE
ncbi:uncharacterized protein PAE49_016103 [Odontesthes bonariensis]|uniref:uncharacterized protein LOC142398530 n=1 Tax=Odontesthes bonariensis TaxID=219752 RepID=UPI003F58EAFE